jgi:3',5'-cyclic AMP phosphodiesterase CpdA
VRLRTIVLLVMLFMGAPAFGRDLTFFVWSDTHFGAYDYSDTTRLKIIEQMNRLPGKDYPPGVFAGEAVGRPAFLLHLGDVTEHGLASEWDDPKAAAQRSYVQALKQLTATDKTYEVVGNHDSRGQPNIRQHIARKHGRTYYSFDVEGVHFVVLDPYRNIDTATAHLDESQLEWLKDDLARMDSAHPVIIAMHTAPPGRSSAGNGSRAVENSMDHLWNIVADRNVLAFFHGHVHMAFRGRWFNFDTVAPAGFAYLRRGCPQGHPVFGVVRITESRMTVCGWDWEKERFLPQPVFDKSFLQKKPPSDGSVEPKKAVAHP